VHLSISKNIFVKSKAK